MSPKTAFVLILLLLIFNLFGPSGILHWLNLKNEQIRIEKEIASLKTKLHEEHKHLERFQNSRTVQMRVVRNELGYLLDDELSVEFSDD